MPHKSSESNCPMISIRNISLQIKEKEHRDQYKCQHTVGKCPYYFTATEYSYSLHIKLHVHNNSFILSYIIHNSRTLYYSPPSYMHYTSFIVKIKKRRNKRASYTFCYCILWSTYVHTYIDALPNKEPPCNNYGRMFAPQAWVATKFLGRGGGDDSVQVNHRPWGTTIP